MLPLLAAVGAWEGAWWLRRRNVRASMYDQAKARAAAIGRPLLVIGAPDGGVTAGYGCGDVTIDLQGSSCPVSIQADITKTLPFGDDSAVVFVSCVLEYVDDVTAALRELRRVAGRELYLTRVEPWTLTAYLYPGARRTLPKNLSPESEAAVFKLLPSGHALLRRHNATLAHAPAERPALVRTGAVAAPATETNGLAWFLGLGLVGVAGVALYVITRKGERIDVTHRKIPYDDLWEVATQETFDKQRHIKQKKKLEAWKAKRTVSP